MAHAWACEDEQGPRAIASISGGAPGPADPPCRPTRSVSVLQVHGDADAVVRYEGGRMHEVHPSARDGLAPWIAADGCALPPAELRRFRILEPELVATEWTCSRGRVALWTVPGGGHQLRLGLGFAARTLDFLEGK
jgi:polyhydroxybutyrate depolymerase